MGESWRFRPIQSNIYPPPPSFAFNAPDPNPPPFHRPIQNPQFLDHRPVRDPNLNPLPPPFHLSNDRFTHDELLDRDGLRKRLRIEDPHLLPPHPRISIDDQWRLDMIREHGRQDSHLQADEFDGHRNFQEFSRMPLERFNPMLVQENQRMQVNDFDGHRNFRDFSRLESERKDFYVGEDENVRSGAFGSQIGSTWNRIEENYIGRVSDEQWFLDFWPPITHGRKFDSIEGPSYTLPKQPQYPHTETYHMVPKVVNYEQESHYPSSLQPHLENNIETQYQQRYPFESKLPHFKEARKPSEHHINSMPYGNNDYRMDSGMMGRVHTSQTYPSLPLHPPLPPIDYKKIHYPPPLENKIELGNQQRTPFDENRKPFEPYTNSMPYGSSDYRMDSVGIGRAHTSEMYPPFPSHPPLPPLPPPPEPSPPHFQNKPVVPTALPMSSPVPATTSEPLFPCIPSSQGSFDSHPMVQSNLYRETVGHTSTAFVTEGLSFINETPSKEFMEGRGQKFPPRPTLEDKPTVIDACHLFRQPHRVSRPDHIVIILRGLPGSGKSYLAKALRDLEVESGGNAPRIHSMDDYFMIEVEKKIEDNDRSKSSGSSRGKTQITKKVIEYCYEPEMEEAYRSSMLKAFKKTLDEGNFTFIIVDDRNLRVADFAQFWAIAKRSGYEVYLLEAMYKDPTGCAARNVHGFTVDNIQKMAEQWEEAPSLYLQLDIQSLFCGDDLNGQSIQEVDMDTDDAGGNEVEIHKLQQSESVKITEPKALNHTLDGFLKFGERWNAYDNEEDELTGVKDLGSSKWSKDVDEDIDNSDSAGENLNALSGLIQAYGKNEKSVHWGDQVKQSGFSIGAVKKQSRSSIIIGPGSGYNLSSNPLQEDEDDTLQQNTKSSINESKKKFTEQLRAERESFKAVFDRRRRQRIGGLWDAEDE